MSRKIDATTPPSLVFRLRDHADTSAWAEFVRIYGSMIYNYCRSHQLQAADASDVTQEVLLRVAKAIRSFEYDRTKGMFRDWLARIVLNEIRRLAKKRVDAVTPSEDLDQEFSQMVYWWNEHFHRTILSQALEQCRLHFNDETWTMFERSWIQKIPVEVLVDQLGTAADRIYVARSRVLKRLRYEVARLADDVLP